MTNRLIDPAGRRSAPARLAARLSPVSAALVFMLALVLLSACGGEGIDASDGTATGADVGSEAITFMTSDGLRLSGRVFGGGTVAVVLAHMYPADQESWTTIAQELAAEGYLALTFDFRGYGESEGDKDISNIDKDVEAALRKVEELGAEKVGLVGASMGGTAALVVAARSSVAAVACLSAPVEFRGLSAEQAIASVTAPKLFLAAKDDVGATGAKALFAAAKEPKQIDILPGDGHGTDLLTGSAGAQAHEILFGFLHEHLPVAR